MQIELDSEMNITGMTEGSDPICCLTLMNTDRLKEPSIVDVF